MLPENVNMALLINQAVVIILALLINRAVLYIRALED
jgi:hypothetical protein